MAETIAPPGAIAEIVKEGSVSKKDFQLVSPTYLPESSAFPWRKKEKPFVGKPEDELKKEDILIAKPLKSVKVLVEDTGHYPRPGEPQRMIEKSLDEDLEKEYEYESRTKGIEMGTERTAILQGVVDRMAVGKNLKTRVAILNKGIQANAYVGPDGSIFVTQALLNQLGSLDEVAGVLAHELGHLFNETTAKAIQSKWFNKAGLGWLHESACDFQAPDLLEKAGFNTTAYATAIDIVGANERGLSHQTGHTRGSQSIGTHFFQERTTSNVPLTPLPDILRKEVAHTNLEIGVEYIKQGNLEGLRDLLPNLHPQDLNSIYNSVISAKDNDLSYMRRKKESRNSHAMYMMASDFIAERLTGFGYSETEVRTFILSRISSHSLRGRDSFILGNEDMVYKIAADIDGITERLPGMFKKVFNQEKTFERLGHNSPTSMILDGIERLGYFENFEDSNKRLAITEPILIECLASLSRLTKDDFKVSGERMTEERDSKITGVVADYIKRTYLRMAREAGVEIDQDQLRVFFGALKENGVNMKLDSLLGKFSHLLRAGVEGGDQNIMKANTESVVKIFKEVYGIVDESDGSAEFSFGHIDAFVEDQTRLDREDYTKQREKEGRLGSFFIDMRKYFDENNLSDAERLKYVKYMADKLDASNVVSGYSILDYLNDASLRAPRNVEGQEASNLNFKRFNLKLISALAAFQGDGSEFYSFMGDAMQKSNIDTRNLSKLQLINLCQGLISNEAMMRGVRVIHYGDFYSDSMTLEKGVKISDYKRLLELPFLAQIMGKKYEVPSGSISEVSDWVGSTIKKQNLYSYSGDAAKVIYRDELKSLIVGKEVRDVLASLAKKDIPESELGGWFTFIKEYLPDGVQKDNFLREINRRFLHSDNINLEQKVDYVVEHFDAVGIEGMVVIADQINDMKTYTWFREKMAGRISEYMKGDGFISKLAVGDYLTSALTRNYSTILMTSREDAKAKVDANTQCASAWFESVFSSFGQSDAKLRYDKEEGKFDVGYLFRDQFRSLGDVFTGLKNMSTTQKFAVAHKVLFDTNGAFSSERTKKDLGEQLVKILDIKPGFVASVMQAACSEGDKKFIGFPAARLLANVMMRGLDISAVDKKKLRKDHIYAYDENDEMKNLWPGFTDKELDYIIKSNTRDITLFGARYQKDKNSQAALLAEDSNQKYHEVMDALSVALPLPEDKSEDTKIERIAPNTEAVIQGVEAMGPLGYRSEQLTGQFKRFGSPIDERLSQSFDANPGMNKLIFWENLSKLMETDQEVKSFIEGKQVEIEGYLGGGSLQTTYRATCLNESGERVPIALKMNNPNVEMFITQGWNIAHKVLESASKKGSAVDKGYARMAMKLIDLARDWSMADVNTPTYESDDDAFRANNIASYNEKVQFEVYAPERVFTSKRLKAEDIAEGDTLNRLLKSAEIPDEQKRGIVVSAISFFCSQFKAKPISDEGREALLLHSDPSVGNLMADPGNIDKLGVIDRNLYLKVPVEDVAVLEKLMQGGNDNDFVYSFVDRVLDRNNVEGIKRTTTKGRVIAAVGTEYVKQRARGAVDRLSLLNTMLESIDKAGMDLPYDIRLAIRNIGAMDELGKRYGVDIKQIYQAA